MEICPTAEIFINFILRPEVAAQTTNYTWYGSPVEAFTEFIDPAVMAKLEWLQYVGDATLIYERIRTVVKSAN